MADYYFQMKDLSVGYNGNSLIRDINIGINKGEIVTLIGPNGSGKNSTKNSVNKKGRPPSRQEVVDAQITKPFGLINSFYQASEGKSRRFLWKATMTLLPLSSCSVP